MPACARKGDGGTGHKNFPPRSNNEGSPNVYVNGLPVHRKGDSWEEHCYMYPNGVSNTSMCHTSYLAGGSTTVFINGLECGRIADPVDCGSAVAEGSGNVFIGG